MSKSILFSTDAAINLSIEQIKFSMEQLIKDNNNEISFKDDEERKGFRIVHNRFIKLGLLLGTDENYKLNYSEDIKNAFNECGILIEEKEMTEDVQYSLYLEDDKTTTKFVLNENGRNFTDEEIKIIKNISIFNNRIK